MQLVASVWRFHDELKSQQILQKGHLERNVGHRHFSQEVPQFEMETGDFGWRALQNVIVNDQSALVYEPESNCLLIPFFPYPNFDNICYTQGFVFAKTMDGFVLDAHFSEQQDKGIFFSGTWPNNWYHWIIEIVSRVVLLRSLPAEFDRCPILVPQKCLELKNHREFLLSLLNGREIRGIKGNLAVKNLLYLDAPVAATPQLHGPSTVHDEAQLRIGKKSSILLNEYRQLVLSSYGLDAQKDSRKIFLARRQNRRAYNQKEVSRFLKGKGFEDIYMEDLSVDEQLRTMASAEVVVGPTGAAWANLLFSYAQAAIIWAPDCVDQSTVYTKLAQVAGVDLYYLRFPTPAKCWEEFMRLPEPYEIDLAKLNEGLLHCRIH